MWKRNRSKEDKLDIKEGYKHHVLSCCNTCRNIQLYKVTDDIVEKNEWGSIRECRECSGLCDFCVLSKYQKPPGFARKCKRCGFKFTCATIRIKEMSIIRLYSMRVDFKIEEQHSVNLIT